MPVGVFRVLSATVVVAQHWPIHQGNVGMLKEAQFPRRPPTATPLMMSMMAQRLALP